MQGFLILHDPRIWAAVVVGKDGNYTVTSGKVVGLFVALLIIVRLVSVPQHQKRQRHGAQLAYLLLSPD